MPHSIGHVMGQDADNNTRISHVRHCLTAALVLVVAFNSGCTRKFYRKAADDDVSAVLTQKNRFPDWKLSNWFVYPDPRARFADPNNPDRPPYPPDDYAARVLSPNPQKPTKKWGTGLYEGDGYLALLQTWDAENRAQDRTPETKPGSGKPSDASPGPKPPAEKLPPPLPIEADNPDRLAYLPSLLPADMPAVFVSTPLNSTEAADPLLTLVEATAPPEKLPDALEKEAGKGPQLSPQQASALEDQSTAFLKSLLSKETVSRITFAQSLELGLINSREFQDRRENLYEAALPVTLQRFQFVGQAQLAETIVRDSIGGQATNGPAQNWQFGTDASISKLFPTGATALVQLANQVVINMTGDKITTSVSNLGLTVAQPFLQGGGYAVTLEPLTQAERTLLYGIRSYARFRKLFYVAVVGGGEYTNNPYGLQGLATNLGRGIGNNLTAPTPGYLPTLLQGAVVANQRKNISALERLLKLYEAFREGGQQSDLQVGQVEIQLINSRQALLGSTNINTTGGSIGNSGIRGFLDNIDNFKLQLGIPLTVGLEFDEGPLKPIRQQLARFEAVYSQVQDAEVAGRMFNPADPIDRFRPRWRKILTESELVKGTNFARDLNRRWQEWERYNPDQLRARLTQLAEERRKLLDRRTDRQTRGEQDPANEVTRLAELDAALEIGQFEQEVRRYEAQPWAREKGTSRTVAQAAAFRDVYNTFFVLILEARNERLAVIRGQWPKLPEITVEGVNVIDATLDDSYRAGVQAALNRRLDLLNTRAQLVDSWRQIAVNANALQGVLNATYNLNSQTPPTGSNGAAFSGPGTTSELTINAQLPLVRRAQRNSYRSSLIAYQSARRTVQAFEDNIANDVRGDIRELRTIAELYKMQQRLIELGYSQVDNANAVLLAPPAPANPGQGSSTNDAASAAALTNQALNAQSSLLTAQNTLYTIWVNYLVSRMTFYLDSETMQLDERGLWRDEFSPGNTDSPSPAPDSRGPAAEPLPAPRPGSDDKR